MLSLRSWRIAAPRLAPQRAANALSTSAPKPHAELRKDVKLLGQSLGQVIRAGASGEKTFATVEEMRSLAKEWRADGNAAKFDALVDLSKGLSSETIRETARAFTHFLALANDAETHHRVRRVRARDQSEGGSAGPPKQSSLNSVLGTVQALLKGGGEHPQATPDEIYDALCTQTVDIILTAHPTEVNRRSIIRKHRIIDESLEELDRSDLLWFERHALEARIDRQVNSLWWTDEIRRAKPTPQKEAQQGLDIVESSLWKSVPAFLRRIDAELVATPQLGKPLPPDVAPVKFGSWMGGDRDGNPNVTAQVTKEVVIMSRLRAAALIRESLTDLRRLLTVSIATPALWASLPALHAQGKPYQCGIDQLVARLDATTAMLAAGDLAPRAAAAASEAAKPAPLPLVETSELKAALLAMHASLCGVGLRGLADGDLRDLIRQVSTFGLSLLPLDVRQESTRHSEALDAITTYLGVGSYLAWDEAARTAWLLKELLEARPLLPRHASSAAYADLGNMFTAPVCDVLDTFDMVASIPADGLAAYVISMAKTPSDVLAVRLLQKEAGVARPMRVVPLFETLADLENAEAVMAALWAMPWYKRDTGGKSEVMLGYSDSAKDAGRIAAAWNQFQAQEKLVACAAKHGVVLSLFHGKGGTASRGGDPSTFRAICAQPPGTVSGQFRITEQGEIITQNYAHPPVAERHLGIYTAALLYERFLPAGPRTPTTQHRALLDGMSQVSCDAYRGVVRGNATFIDYFRAATPELEIASLNVGSRPAKRRPTGGVETLRAIPWVFAWTQTRLNLTAWLGMGPALENLAPRDAATLKDMYASFPWFAALVDVVDMVMAKSEAVVAQNYDAQLVATLDRADVGTLLALGATLRAELDTTKHALLALRGFQVPQEHNDMLLRGLAVRNPYVDPLNVLQAEVLRRLRQGEFRGTEERQLLEDALVITINGIANGQKNTG